MRRMDASPRQRLLVDGPTLLLPRGEDESWLTPAQLFLDLAELLLRGQRQPAHASLASSAP